jgi:hypothetical protein
MPEERVSATKNYYDAVGLMDPEGKLRGAPEEARRIFGFLLLALAWDGFGKVRVKCVKRTSEEQGLMYGKGRTIDECRKAHVPEAYARPSEAKVTWIKPEDSRHIAGKAMDLDVGEYGDAVWSRVGWWAARLGMVWGGNWKVRDRNHVEV